jgi:hypothetical protein
MPDGNHVVDADIRCDGNIAREIEVDRHLDEFIQRHQVVGCDQQSMPNEHINVFFWTIDVGSFKEEKVRMFIDK